MRTSMLTLAAALTVLAGPAMAQPVPPPPPAAPPADPLGEGTVTRADAQARAADLFARMDANHDGKLDEADRAAHMAAMFDRIDANHDGVLSREEFVAAHARMPGPMGPMGAMGPMGDGPQSHGRMAHRRMGHGPMGAYGAEHGPMGAGGPPPVLTREAFLAGAMKRFDGADRNHDGKLTREERRQGHRAMGAGDMPPPPPPPAQDQ